LLTPGPARSVKHPEHLRRCVQEADEALGPFRDDWSGLTADAFSHLEHLDKVWQSAPSSSDVVSERALAVHQRDAASVPGDARHPTHAGRAVPVRRAHTACRHQRTVAPSLHMTLTAPWVRDPQLQIDIMGVHLSEKYWARPTDFYPEHFDREQVEARDAGAFMPFGGGHASALA